MFIKKIITSFLLFLLPGAFVLCSPLYAQDSAVVAEFQTFIGQDFETAKAYVNDTGHRPDGFMMYTSLAHLEGLESAADVGAGIQNAQGLTAQYPGSKLQIGLYLVGALQETVSGAYDQNLLKLAQWFIKNDQTKIYLRIGYEFDNPQNNYEPAQYIKAYQRIVDTLRAQGVSNVFYVWHSYAAFVAGDIERWYPGDAYVDWVGLSFFDAYAQANRQRVVKIAQKHGKPLMIAEATPRGVDITQGQKAWNAWYARLFDFVKTNDVKMICYINWHWEKIPMFQGQGWGNARVQDNALIKEKWLQAVSKPEEK